MRVILAHNYYQQPGGEDVAFEAEARLLEERGHRVVRFTARNDDVRHMAPHRLAAKTLWNGAVYRQVARLLELERPDVLHVHNTLPLISPSIYYAARAAGVPIVQTLHNYRLLCPSAILFRDGRVCEDCVGRAVPTPGVRHACYRHSRSASAAVAAMSAVHRMMGTWTRRVDLFIALTEFARVRFIAGGIPPERVLVKPNFTVDPGIRASGGGYALFVGRLSEEKGYRVLLEAWRALADRIPLVIIGDGPGADQVARAAEDCADVRFLGRRTAGEVVTAMAGARFLVFPSVWYETFGLTMIEAYAVGIPVIASRLGAMAELVDHRRTGLHFHPGDPADLVRQVAWALAHPREWEEMGRNARLEYERCYTPERNYELLVAAYRRASGTGALADSAAHETRVPNLIREPLDRDATARLPSPSGE
jgi:glycosyltransferase involved in cell wall biosynthesis